MISKQFARLVVLACTGAAFAGAAAAQSAQANDVVWVNNDSFEYTRCATAAGSSDADRAAQALQDLRSQAGTHANELLRSRGLAPDGRYTVTLTPVQAQQDCSTKEDHVTVLFGVLDKSSGQWVTTQHVARSGGALVVGQLSRP